MKLATVAKDTTATTALNAPISSQCVITIARLEPLPLITPPLPVNFTSSSTHSDDWTHPPIPPPPSSTTSPSGTGKTSEQISILSQRHSPAEKLREQRIDTVAHTSLCRPTHQVAHTSLCRPTHQVAHMSLCRPTHQVAHISLCRPIHLVAHTSLGRPTHQVAHMSLCRPIHQVNGLIPCLFYARASRAVECGNLQGGGAFSTCVYGTQESNFVTTTAMS